MSNQEEWEGHAKNILELLKGSAETRQQAIVMLDTLVDIAADEGYSQAFDPIFNGVDPKIQKFRWMTKHHSKLSWSERKEFFKEYLFWPLFDLYLRLNPEKVNELPYDFNVANIQGIPEFLKSENPVTHLNIESAKSVEGISELDGVSVVSFNMDSWAFGKIEDIPTTNELRTGSGAFQLVGPERNSLYFAEVDGERELKIATGRFSPEEGEDALNKYPHLESCNLKVQDINEEVWSQRTQHDSLDLGFIQIQLKGDKSKTIRERVHSLYLRMDLDELQEDWDNLISFEEPLLEQILGEGQFPDLRDIILKGEFDQPKLNITASLLEKCPALHTVYCEIEGYVIFEESLIIEKDCWGMKHPFSNLFVNNREAVQFFLFDEQDGEQTLEERLWQLSVSFEFVRKNAESLKNLTYLNLFENIQEDISAVTQLRKLDELNIEASVDGLDDWKYDFEENAFEERIQPILEGKSDTPPLPEAFQYRDIMRQVDADGSASMTKKFMKSMKKRAETNSFPAFFVEWLKEKSGVKISRYWTWMDDAGLVSMKTYHNVGLEYLKQVTDPEAYYEQKEAEDENYQRPYDYAKTFSAVNVERLLIGVEDKDISVIKEILENQESTLLSLKYNKTGIPLEHFLRLMRDSDNCTLYLEVGSKLEILCAAPDAEKIRKLYLQNLDLKELPESIGNLKNLRELYLWGNELSGLPYAIRELENLELINISGNNFTEIPEALFALPKLKTICLRDSEASLLEQAKADEGFRAQLQGALNDGLELVDATADGRLREFLELS